jgi:hypothetical protein
MWLIDIDPGYADESQPENVEDVKIETLEYTVDSGTGTFAKDDGTITGEPPLEWGHFFKSGDVPEDVVFHGRSDVSIGDKVYDYFARSTHRGYCIPTTRSRAISEAIKAETGATGYQDNVHNLVIWNRETRFPS